MDLLVKLSATVFVLRNILPQTWTENYLTIQRHLTQHTWKTSHMIRHVTLARPYLREDRVRATLSYLIQFLV